ncbi:MAG: L,D-transpeptidase [Candidatus Dormibacteria bacterium]
MSANRQFPGRMLQLGLAPALGMALLCSALLLQPAGPAAVGRTPEPSQDRGDVRPVAAEAPLPVPVTIPVIGAPLLGTEAPLLPLMPGAPPVVSTPATPPSPLPSPPVVNERPSTGDSAACASFPTGKAIVIGLAGQDLTACQDGTAVSSTLVTTGRPELPTPTGTTAVLRKSSPWVMRSPWGRGSRYWYPPSHVDFVLWFREGGYGIHDAPWRDAYGPGTERQGSHGCVNVPRAAMEPLFRWADIGTPVQVV